MSIEAEVIEKWLEYATATIDEIAEKIEREGTEYARKVVEEASAKIERERAEREYQTIVAVSNTLHILANMYSIHKKVLQGKNPHLRKGDINIFGLALKAYKEIEPPIWINIKYPEIVHALEDAYIGLGRYITERNEKK